jgi:hypothetical protein
MRMGHHSHLTLGQVQELNGRGACVDHPREDSDVTTGEGRVIDLVLLGIFPLVPRTLS